VKRLRLIGVTAGRLTGHCFQVSFTRSPRTTLLSLAKASSTLRKVVGPSCRAAKQSRMTRKAFS
jgi:hypothetical protein